jgi:hypothetical protein
MQPHVEASIVKKSQAEDGHLAAHSWHVDHSILTRTYVNIRPNAEEICFAHGLPAHDRPPWVFSLSSFVLLVRLFIIRLMVDRFIHPSLCMEQNLSTQTYTCMQAKSVRPQRKLLTGQRRLCTAPSISRHVQTRLVSLVGEDISRRISDSAEELLSVASAPGCEYCSLALIFLSDV